VVEEQEEVQFSDGIDGPSNFTDPAVPPATVIGFASSKLYLGRLKCGATSCLDLVPIYPLEDEKFSEWQI
jgi:hypothetical protein